MTDVYATQLSAEAWVAIPAPADLRATQVSAEAWVSILRPNDARATQVVGEVWVYIRRPNDDRGTQVSAEVWATTRGLGLTYPVYPTLPGLGYSVFWRPNFANAPTAVAANKAEIDLALADTPVHEFTLTYDFLRNQTTYLLDPITNEFKQLFGFFLRVGANAGRFVFENPYDSSTTGSFVGTTDGSSVRYGPIQRTFGVGDDSGTEPVGYVNLTQTLNVYLDGVLENPSNYEIDRTYPCNQKIRWFLAPTTGQDITIDCSYYYYCKFADDGMSFETFMDKLWTVKQVVIRSNRGSA